MSFYNNQGGNSNPGGGFYNSGGGYGGDQFQNQQQTQQQPGYNNFSQWQQQPSSQTNPNNATNNSTQQFQQKQQPMPSNNTQQSSTPFWNPTTATAVAGFAAQAAAGGFSNDAALDLAGKLGSKVWQSGPASMIPGFDRTMHILRSYYAVDNYYVKRKMQKVLFPFFSRQWRRMQTEGPEMVNYALPNSDENAPDLYLPVMSLITYCLLAAFCYGAAGEFSPEVIADVITKCFITQVMEVLLIRFGFYMMQSPIAILDLFSYTGYKYLGLTCNMVSGLILGQMGYGVMGFYVTFLWTASAASFFMLKTMANNIPTQTSTAGPKREIMVLAFAGSQAATMWFVSQTKFL